MIHRLEIEEVVLLLLLIQTIRVGRGRRIIRSRRIGGRSRGTFRLVVAIYIVIKVVKARDVYFGHGMHARFLAAALFINGNIGSGKKLRRFRYSTATRTRHHMILIGEFDDLFDQIF